ncbi:DNase I-like protein [Dioscorea alata]|uniref:DNase I-like protein n=1 Tax=Dioscorea alata TaxID=55571 RepID=A0ACB7VSZ0_DIOAL|nr:DNase I-like protein [Dioscorea alata]
MSGQLVQVGEFSLTVDFCSTCDLFRWSCTNVYGPIARSRKGDFWAELRNCATESSVPWVIYGDFNAIFSVGDKSFGAPNFEDIRQAGTFMIDLGLLELCSTGKHFTWTNGQENPLWVKLDRFLVNLAFVEHFPRLSQICLPRIGSDHVPLHLEAGFHLLPCRQFRFKLMWLTVEGFHELIHKWWTNIAPEGCGAFLISKKLAYLKGQLHHWAKFNFGSIKLRKLSILHDLESLDTVSESQGLSAVEACQQRALLDRMEDIRKQEEIYWKQRSRSQWLKEGDENTKFFHAVENGRRNRNFISSIECNGRSAEALG